MNGLLKLRERGIRFFKEYETWFRIIGKFIGMMLVFNCINTKLGYMQILCQTPVVILLSLICSIIPSGFVLFLAFAVTAGVGVIVGAGVAAAVSVAGRGSGVGAA